MNKLSIYVVEDDEWFREFISYTLSLVPEYEVRTFESGRALEEALPERPDVVTLDFRLPDTDGGTLLKKIKAQSPETEVIIISEQKNVSTALDLLKSGAYDYLVKSKEMRDLLLNTVGHIGKNRALRQRIDSLEQEVEKKYRFGANLIGASPAFKEVFSLIEKATVANINVMITGDTGTGKEEVARAIHFNSPMRKGPFMAVNMAAIPRELAESELFGHERGAFTGATGMRRGKFEEANNGTLFLDEIGDLDPSLQSKLLRVLQDKQVVRVGSAKPIRINCRLLVATHKNLQAEVRAGRFREDLYYRLFGLQVKLPPLRERGSDVLLLANHFISKFTNANNLPLKSLSAGAQQKLRAYPFPGNVRELRSLVELAVVMANGDEIQPHDIQIGEDHFITDLLATEQTLEEYNRRIIFHFLRKYDNNVVTTAGKLGIGKSTIYRMLKENGKPAGP